jgi:signal transduction histidine kinase
VAALSIVKFDSGFSEIIRGALYDCPAEFFSLQQMAFYQGCKLGWSRCPLGYSTFAALDAMGRKFVVPGNIVPGDQAPNRKFPNWQIRFPRASVEQFLAPHLGVSETVRQQRDIEFKNLTHDLRAISTEIYHTALNAKQTVDSLGSANVSNALTSVMNAQQMMSLRLDIVDYESGHSATRPKENISVFKKVEKVLKCFTNRMNHRGLRYRTEGNQFYNTFGPPIFEIIPFVIVENAVKYSPPGSEITVRFEENPSEIIVRFESYGPKIKESEKAKVFDQHFRGEAARDSERSGSGIGLYAAKTLLESQFGGRIYVTQIISKALWYNAELFYLTRFTIVLPVSHEINSIRPAHGSARRRRAK